MVRVGRAVAAESTARKALAAAVEARGESGQTRLN